MNKTGVLIFLLLFIQQVLFAQEPVKTDTNVVKKFSLSQAQQFALENNNDVKNKQIDKVIAQKTVWETTAIGLPQLSVSASGTYNPNPPVLEMSVSIPVPISETADPYDHQHVEQIVNLQLGTEFGGSVDFTLSQLLFSGEYIVGLQASRTFKMMSEQNLVKSEMQIKSAVAQSYYLVLNMKENTAIVDSTYKNLLSIYNDMKKMYETGFMEESNIDQLSITLNELEITLRSLEQQTLLSEKLLKLQMGLEMEDKIELTDSLSMFNFGDDLNQSLINDFNISNNIDYQMIETQEKLTTLSYKREVSKYLPTISAFYRHQIQINAPSFNFQSPDLFGLSAQLPLFTSGMRNVRVQKAKLEMDKMANMKDQVTTGLQIQFEQARNDYSTAFQKYQLQEKNIALARKIYNNTLIKYKSGVVSSMDLDQAQSQMLDVQSKYFRSKIEMLNAKLKMDDLSGKK